MNSVDAEFILEPMKFILSEKLLSGHNGKEVIDGSEITEDKRFALNLSISQDLLNGYVVWKDSIDNAIGKFRLESKFHEAEKFF